jgi:hypothetical protein
VSAVTAVFKPARIRGRGPFGRRQPTFKGTPVWLGYLGALLAYSAICSTWQAEPVPQEAFAAAIALCVVCLLPLALWYALGTPGVPTFELICVTYLFSYSTPVFIRANQILLRSKWVPLGWDETTRALQASLLGVSLMAGAYFALRRIQLLDRLPTINPPLGQKWASAFVLVGLALGTYR